MIVMLPKKGKLLKTVIMANCKEVGDKGGSWEGAERSRGADLDRFVGQPLERPWLIARTASADRSNGRDRGRSCVWALMSSEIQKIKCGLRWTSTHLNPLYILYFCFYVDMKANTKK